MRRLVPELDAAAVADDLAVRRRLAALLGRGAPPPEPAALPQLRRQRRDGAAPFPAPWRHAEAADMVITGPGGPLPLRILAPPVVRGAYLHVAGGGWCTGSADLADAALWHLTSTAGIAVVSAATRLAPEHPHPAPVDDALAALRWFTSDGVDVLGTDRLALGGDSTGAHLALLAALRMRDEPAARAPVRALNLAVGIYDLSAEAGWRTVVSEDPLLDATLLTRYVEWFAPEPSDWTVASPLFHPLHDLPPMLVTAAGLDPLCDESHRLAAAADAAGVDVTLVEYPGASHGFATFDTAMARHALDLQASFLTRHLSERLGTHPSPNEPLGAPR